MKLQNILVVYYVHNYKTLQLVEQCLQLHKIKFRATRRVHLTKAMVKNKDLIIVVGGDGTFLRTAHHVQNTPVLAVSSDTKYNEAFYSRATPENFSDKFTLLLEGKYKITKLPRLEAKINGIKAPFLAINEIFAGAVHPFHTSRYTLTIRGKKEYQKSSGVLISTKTGASGWASSATRKPIRITKEGFGYVVREPYFGKHTNPKLLQAALKKNEKVKITSHTHKGIVVVDSTEKMFKFIDNDVLEVKVSSSPLNYIEF